ncbi:MAG: hypothetical protein CMO40_06510 [Verrucomicrobiaceae bacterium]|nr:hypothetical protein [Verrucomicrobiaceae bacterium]
MARGELLPAFPSTRKSIRRLARRFRGSAGYEHLKPGSPSGCPPANKFAPDKAFFERLQCEKISPGIFACAS